VYAYTIKSRDTPDCQMGFPEFMRATYEGSPAVVRWGGDVYSAPWVAIPGHRVYNCNFEVVALARFRTPHYRAFWTAIEAAGLFFSTRLGDHQVKTTYLNTFEPAENVVCYQGLPYIHPHVGPDSFCVEPGARIYT
jgi:hypothetical protein